MLYNSNFDNSSFQSVNWREFNKSIDDPCTIQQRTEDNEKKLKFVTTNHIDLLEAKNNLNFYGMTLKDSLFVPSDNIDKDSNLRIGSHGNIMTNCKIRNEFGQLPFPTMPSRYQLHHGDVDVEDSIRNLSNTNKKACNPKDDDFHNRYFYIFGVPGVEKINPVDYVETKKFGPRGGISTRFRNNE
jgi:hypothetical protein